MTLNEAKKDYAARLTAAGVKFGKMTARTISFEGLGYGRAVFVAVHGAEFPRGCGPKSYITGLPKPSEGGYVPEAGAGCRWGGVAPRVLSSKEDSNEIRGGLAAEAQEGDPAGRRSDLDSRSTVIC